MTEKNKKEEKVSKIRREMCIDCCEPTRDWYPISTNRGTVYRCASCHELWVLRSTRMSVYNQHPE